MALPWPDRLLCRGWVWGPVLPRGRPRFRGAGTLAEAAELSDTEEAEEGEGEVGIAEDEEEEEEEKEVAASEEENDEE